MCGQVGVEFIGPVTAELCEMDIGAAWQSVWIQGQGLRLLPALRRVLEPRQSRGLVALKEE